MCTYVRTTMVIDDDLMREARRRAAEDGISVSELLNRALRAALARVAPTEPSPPFRMVTFGRGQAKVDHRSKEFTRILEEEDEASLRGS
jgi:hypothetical protein